MPGPVLLGEVIPTFPAGHVPAWKVGNGFKQAALSLPFKGLYLQ